MGNGDLGVPTRKSHMPEKQASQDPKGMTLAEIPHKGKGEPVKILDFFVQFLHLFDCVFL